MTFDAYASFNCSDGDSSDNTANSTSSSCGCYISDCAWTIQCDQGILHDIIYGAIAFGVCAIAFCIWWRLRRRCRNRGNPRQLPIMVHTDNNSNNTSVQQQRQQQQQEEPLFVGTTVVDGQTYGKQAYGTV